MMHFVQTFSITEGLLLFKRFEIIKKKVFIKTLLKVTGGGMHPPQPFFDSSLYIEHLAVCSKHSL